MKEKTYNMQLIKFVRHTPFVSSDHNLIFTGTGYYVPKGHKGKSAIKLSVVYSMPDEFDKKDLSKITLKFEKGAKK